jgi:hypothetical protein
MVILDSSISTLSFTRLSGGVKQSRMRFSSIFSFSYFYANTFGAKTIKATFEQFIFASFLFWPSA